MGADDYPALMDIDSYSAYADLAPLLSRAARAKTNTMATCRTPSYPVYQQYPGYFDETVSDEISFSDHESNFDSTAAETPAIELERNHYSLEFLRPVTSGQLFGFHQRPANISLSAHLSGKFLQAIQPTGCPTAIICYRRNLFSVTGSITMPKNLRYIWFNGEYMPIESTELMISAAETLESAPIKLVSVPFKGAQAASSKDTKGDVEPNAQSLISFDNLSIGPDYVTLPIEWKRLQFRVSTANNGRRKELQQHFVLNLKVIATLSRGRRVSIFETSSEPIIVRGRSPRNFAPKSVAGAKSIRSRSSTMEPTVSLTKTLSEPNGSFRHMALPTASFNDWHNTMTTSGYPQNMPVQVAHSYEHYAMQTSPDLSLGMYPSQDEDYFSQSPPKRSRTSSQRSPRISPYIQTSFSSYAPQSSYEYLPPMPSSWTEQIDAL